MLIFIISLLVVVIIPALVLKAKSSLERTMTAETMQIKTYRIRK